MRSRRQQLVRQIRRKTNKDKKNKCSKIRMRNDNIKWSNNQSANNTKLKTNIFSCRDTKYIMSSLCTGPHSSCYAVSKLTRASTCFTHRNVSTIQLCVAMWEDCWYDCSMWTHLNMYVTCKYHKAQRMLQTERVCVYVRETCAVTTRCRRDVRLRFCPLRLQGGGRSPPEQTTI